MPSIPGLPLFALTRLYACQRFLRSQTSSINCSWLAGRSVSHFAVNDSVPSWASRSFARSPATVGLLSGSCSSARVFAPRFFQAPPRGECCFTLALRYDFTSIKLSKGLSPPNCRTCSAHKEKGDLRRSPLAGEAILIKRFSLPEFPLPHSRFRIASRTSLIFIRSTQAGLANHSVQYRTVMRSSQGVG